MILRLSRREQVRSDKMLKRWTVSCPTPTVNGRGNRATSRRTDHPETPFAGGQRLPVVKTLDEFDFSFQRPRFHELGFVERRTRLVDLPVSERPISSVAIAAAQNGRRVYGTLAELIARGSPSRRYVHDGSSHPSLLVV